MKRLESIISTFIGKFLVKVRLLNQIFYGLIFLLGGALVISWMFLGLVSISEFIFQLIKFDLLLFCVSEIMLLGFFSLLKYWETKNLMLIKKINQLVVNDRFNQKVFNGQETFIIKKHPQKKEQQEVYLHPLVDDQCAAFGERRLHIEIIRKAMGLGECFFIAQMIYMIESGGHFFIFLGFFGATLLLTIVKGFLSSAELKTELTDY